MKGLVRYQSERQDQEYGLLCCAEKYPVPVLAVVRV